MNMCHFIHALVLRHIECVTMLMSVRKENRQIRRITKYEKMLDEAERLLAAGKSSARLDGLIGALDAYYQSPLWKRDYADDEAGLLPVDLKRGVLSEDGIYHLLERYKELSEE